jgi:leucyl/phenylalanyl-tRNA--protein transferase
MGADLEPSTLVAAYSAGIFPWPHTGMTLPWFSPDPRAVIPVGSLHVSRSLRRRLRGSVWTATVDDAFSAVVTACATRDEGTWITPEMRTAYARLHRLGWAHSVEVWDGARLVGGVYGVQIGAVFTGESMFHRSTDGSKVALAELDARLGAAGAVLLDVQIPTPHLESLGAATIPRRQYLRILERASQQACELGLGREPVARLAERAPQ